MAPDQCPFPLVPDPDQLRRAGRAAVDRLAAHAAALGAQRVARRYTAAELAAVVDEPLPVDGAGIEPCLARFFDELLPHCTLVNHPRFFAYIPGPGSAAGAIGELVAAATNLFVGTWLGGAAMTRLELVTLDWLRQALGLPTPFTGIFTSGGSIANLSALAAALDQVPDRARAVVYTSDETHYSMRKAARILGVAKALVRTLPSGPEQRLDPATLSRAVADDRAAGLRPAFLCANAGSTTTGAVDPLAELAAVCRSAGIWFHVDAAYGGAVAVLPEERARLHGWDQADSITLDPHKWLYAPFECGCLLTRRVDALRGAFAAEPAGYMQDVPVDEVNPFERGPELSRANRALKLWFLIRACGIGQIRAAVAADLRHAVRAHDRLRADPNLVIVTPPRLSVFTFAHRQGEARSAALLEAILADGELMLSSSRVAGRYVLRLCVANPQTTDADVDRAVDRIRELAR